MSRERRAFSVAAGAAALVWAGFASGASACSCAPVSRELQVPAMAAIFVGVVVDVPEPSAVAARPGAEPLTYRFRVSRALKGDIDGEVEVRTAASPAACGARFAEGGRYLVFARRRNGHLETSLCDFNVDGGELDRALSEVERALATGG